MSQERLLIYIRDSIEWAFSCDTKSNVLESNNIASAAFGSKCLVPPWAFSQTPFVQAVNALEEHEKTLVKFVVGLQVTERDMSNMMLPIWAAFYQQYLAYHRLNASTFPKTQRLLEFALMNYKLSVAQQPLVNNNDIMNAIGIKDRKSFTRDWKPRLAIMNTVITKTEHIALNKVINRIDNKRRKHA